MNSDTEHQAEDCRRRIKELDAEVLAATSRRDYKTADSLHRTRTALLRMLARHHAAGAAA